MEVGASCFSSWALLITSAGLSDRITKDTTYADFCSDNADFTALLLQYEEEYPAGGTVGASHRRKSRKSKKESPSDNADLDWETAHDTSIPLEKQKQALEALLSNILQLVCAMLIQSCDSLR